MALFLLFISVHNAFQSVIPYTQRDIDLTWEETHDLTSCCLVRVRFMVSFFTKFCCMSWCWNVCDDFCVSSYLLIVQAADPLYQVTAEVKISVIVRHSSSFTLCNLIYLHACTHICVKHVVHCISSPFFSNFTLLKWLVSIQSFLYYIYVCMCVCVHACNSTQQPEIPW